MDYCSDFKYDLNFGIGQEVEIGEVLKGSTFEVKYDRMAVKTGNLFFERESRGKLSGVMTSQADYYVYCSVGGIDIHMYKTSDLKMMVEEYIGTEYDIVGGDNNTSKGILLSAQMTQTWMSKKAIQDEKIRQKNVILESLNKNKK